MKELPEFVKRIFQLVLFTLLIFLSFPSVAQKSKCMDYGVGVGADYYMFNDFFKFGSGWTVKRYLNGAPITNPLLLTNYRVDSDDDYKVVNGAYWTYDTDMKGTINNDPGQDADTYIDYWDMMVDQGKVLPSGYPTSIPDTIYQYKSKLKDPNQGIDSKKPIYIGEVTRSFGFPDGVLPGTWVMKWKGKGKFVFDGVAKITSVSPNTTATLKSGTTYEFNSEAGGRIELDYAPVPWGRYLTITASDASDPIRDIQFIYPGMESLVDAGEILNPLFTDKISQYKVIRYMDYMAANGVPQRQYVYANHKYYKSGYLEPMKWSERTQAGGINAAGVHEYIIAISNKTKTNPWVNIPYCAGQDYIEKMVKFYLDNLDPDLKVYLEVGNELWNNGNGAWNGRHWVPSFAGYYWMDGYGTYANLGLNSYGSAGTHINELYGWATAVAGSNLNRFVRCVGTQTGYYAVTNYICDQIKPQNWDALAYAWYFDVGEFRRPLYDYWQANPGDQPGFNKKFLDYHQQAFRKNNYPQFKAQSDMAKGYGKRFVTYEGGNGSLGGGSNGPDGHLSNPEEFNPNGFAVYQQYMTDNGFIYAMAEADNKSAESAILFNEVLDSMMAVGTELANHYGFAGKTTSWGIWNLFQNSDEGKDLAALSLKYTKFKAFNDRVKQDNCNNLFVNLPADTIGAGLAIKLDGSDDYIQIDNSKPNESGNYTIEAWVKPAITNVKSYIFGLSNTSQTGNTNAVYIRDDGKIVWEINASGNVMSIVGTGFQQDKWYHVATTKNGQRYTLYVNGKNVASTNNAIVAGTKDKFSIGTLFSGSAKSNLFKGQIDEVKVWNVARSEDEVRDYMCKKVPKASIPAALVGYYRFDDGNKVVNSANLSAGNKPALLMNVGFSEYSGYTVSGAALGDESKYSYPSSWTGVTVSFSHSDGDNIGVNNIGPGSPDGIQIYWVNEGPYYKFVPDHYEKIATNKYFGVFMANGTDPTYDLSYMYQGNPGAGSGAEEDKNRLLRKDDGSIVDWKHSGAKLDKVAHRLNLLCKEKNRGDYNIGFRPDNKIVRPGSGMALSYQTDFVDGTASIISQTLPDFGDYTVTFWAKGSGYLVNVYATSGAQGYQQNNENIIESGYGLSFRYNGYHPSGINGPSTSDNDHWYHYSVVRKGTHVTLYVNGNKTAEADFIDITVYNRIQIMTPPNWTGSFGFHAMMDEFTFWNTALDQKTIRDWMCKKITNEHPYSCKNLLLYFNFDEGLGTVLEDKNGSGDMIMTPGFYTYVPSGAAIGDVSAYDYDTPEDISFATPQGDLLEAKRTSGVSNGVQLYRVDNMSPVKNKVNDPSILAMDSSRYWGLYVCYLPGSNPAYDVTDHYQGNLAVKDDTKLRLLDRYDNADSIWTNPSTQVVSTIAKTIKIPSQFRGEYVLGGDNGTFIFNAPSAPVFLAEQLPKLNTKTICGNSTGFVYRVKKDPSAVSYNWVLPQELDGFSNKDSIVISADYTGDTPVSVNISVEAINSFGKSTPTVYAVTINPEPTKADAGPDQFILPPNSSAVMDGNIAGSNETGTWSIGKGNGTIATATNPKTNINSLQSGVDVFVWTIKPNSGTCPPSIDSVKIIFGPPPINITLADGSALPPFICGGTTVTLKAVPAEGVVPNGYTWTLPQGFRLLSSSGNTAVVESSDQGVGGTFKVKALYGTDNTASDVYESAWVSIEAQPNKPVFDNAPPGLCFNVATTVSAALDPTANSYIWTYPDGIKINSYPPSTSNSAVIRGWKMVSGYITLQAFHNGCTNAQAIDSFFVSVKTSPTKPYVYLMRQDGWAERYCNDDAIYSVVDPDPTLTYHWTWDDRYVKLREYFGPNNNAVRLDRRLIDGAGDLQAGVWVYATNDSASCNTSESFLIDGWWRANTGNKPDSIKITSPVGQDISALQVGQTYDLTTSCSTCPRTIQEGEPIFQDNYYWDVPKGIEIVKDGNAYDNNITIKVDAPTAGPIRAWAVTLKGCVGGADTLIISTPDGVALPVYVSGNTTICTGTNLTIHVKDVNADQYIWYLPNAEDSIITYAPVLDIPTAAGMGGDLIVKAYKGTVFSEPVKIPILVKSSILPPTTFFDGGKNPITNYPVCLGVRNQAISIKDIYAKEYVWFIDQPRGILQFEPFLASYDKNENGKIDTLNNNSPDNEYNIISPRTTWRDTTNTFDNASSVNGNGTNYGYIYILSKNGCKGPDRVDSLHYELAISAQVQQPVFSDAPTTVCVGSKVTYKINELSGVYQYIWTVPSGLVANELITTIPQITVDVINGTGGKVSVYGISKICGGGATPLQYTDPITIQGAPVDFHFIDPPLSGCLGDTLKFKVNDVGASKYTWSLPGGLANTIVDDSDPNVKAINGAPNGGGRNQWEIEYVDGTVNNENRITHNGPGNDNDTLIYNFTVQRTGSYNIYLTWRDLWWDASSTVPIEVYSKAGMAKQFINQQNGGRAFLGKFDFEAGKPGMVKIYTYEPWATVRGDAITLVSLGFDGGTEMSFVASTNESGSVCVTIPNASCPAGYTICTDNINLSEELKDPMVSVQANSVCEGKVYKYSVADIGADSYTWILPAGWKIGTEIDTVKGQGRTVEVIAGPNSGNPVKIGVRGSLKCGNKISAIAYTKDINYSNSCKLSTPVFSSEFSSICEGNAVVYSINPVSGATSYEWTLPAGLSRSADNQTGTVITQDNTISIIGTGVGTKGYIKVKAKSLALGSSDEDSTSKEIRVVDGLSAGRDTMIGVCGSQSIVDLFSKLGDKADAGGSWTDLDNSGALTNGSFDPSKATAGKTYRFNYVVMPKGCSNDTAMVTVNIGDETLSSITFSALVGCQGDSITLSSGALTGNQWYKDGVIISKATGQVYMAKVSGSYNVVSTAGGCPSDSAGKSVMITISPKPDGIISVSGSTSFCPGGSVKLSSRYQTGNQWFKDGQLMSTTDAELPVNEEGYYNLIVTLGSCVSDSSGKGKAVYIKQNPATKIMVSKDLNICLGDSVILSSVSDTGNQWYKNGEPIAEAINKDYTAATSGTYNLIFTLGEGCVSDSSASAQRVIVNPKPVSTITSSSSSFCEGSIVVLSSGAVSGNQWYKDGQIITADTNQSYTATKAGNYNVVVTKGACISDTVNTGKQLKTISVSKSLTITSGDVCAGLDGKVTIEQSESGVRYDVYVNSDSVATGNGTGGNLVVSILNKDLTKTNNTVTIMAKTVSCSKVAMDKSVNIAITDIEKDLPVTGGTSCYDEEGTVTISNSQAGVSYEPYINNVLAGAPVQSGGGVLLLTITKTLLSQNGNIVTIKASGFGCNPQTLTNTASISVKPEIQKPGRVAGPEEICKGDEVVYSIAAEAGKTYVWSKPSVADTLAFASDPSEATLKLHFNDSIHGKEYVTVKVKEGNCYSDTSGLAVKTKPNCGEIFIPNIITPGTSDNNNAWTIQGIQNYPNADIKIMNRWGSVVYQTKGYNKLWDGNSKNNEPLPTGTYYYIIDLQNKGASSKKNTTYNGSVTIMR